MAEITLRDLCRWERNLALIPPAGVSREVALDRGLSWAVSVRAAPPHLPPLRGEELVVLPLRVLEQIEAGEAATRQVLQAELARQPIAAILTEPGFSETPIDHLPILTLPTPFPLDAESTFNRMITERRAELYRLGAELSRRLSQAVADPRGVEALLASAAELAGRDLLLEDAEGNVVVWTGEGEGEGPPEPSVGLLGRARALDSSLLIAGHDGREHLIVSLTGQAGAPSPGYLSLAAEAGTLTESDRLILTQTAVTCGAILGQSTRLTPSRDGRERLVADLLLGRLASSAAAQARAHTLGLDGGRLVVGLAEAPREAVARDVVLQALPQRANLASVPGGVGFLLPDGEQATVLSALRRAAERAGREVAVALSRPVESATEAPQALREARFALVLRRSGGVSGQVIACESVLDLGLYSLLFPLWGNPAIQRFVTALLGPLLDYDQRRGSELIETLDTYLAHGATLIEAAAALNIHRNTLAYRLQRIEELSGHDLANPRDRLLLQVALAAHRLPDPTAAS